MKKRVETYTLEVKATEFAHSIVDKAVNAFGMSLANMKGVDEDVIYGKGRLAQPQPQPQQPDLILVDKKKYSRPVKSLLPQQTSRECIAGTFKHGHKEHSCLLEQDSSWEKRFISVLPLDWRDTELEYDFRDLISDLLSQQKARLIQKIRDIKNIDIYEYTTTQDIIDDVLEELE